MSLNETRGWKYAGSETTCKMDDETRMKHIVFVETCKREKSKASKPYVLYPWYVTNHNTSSHQASSLL
jgi:hypothetical protein